MTQPQLIAMSLKASDVVYTPDDVARNIVDYFRPSGTILEPCAGDGAFLKYLPPDTEWCEIEKGRDFFAYHKPVEWIVGNPPYSIFNEWLRHSFEIAENIVYLIPINKMYNDFGMFKAIHEYGGIRTIYAIGRGERANFPMGYAVGACHLQRGYKGGTFTVFA